MKAALLLSTLALVLSSACALDAELEQVELTDTDTICEISSIALKKLEVFDNLDSTSAHGEFFIKSNVRSYLRQDGDYLIDEELPRLILTEVDDVGEYDIEGITLDTALILSYGEFAGLQLVVTGNERDLLLDQGFTGQIGISLTDLAAGEREFEVEGMTPAGIFTSTWTHVFTATYEIDADCTEAEAEPAL